MLLKGILLGIFTCIVSLFLFYRFMYCTMGFTKNTSLDLRGLDRLAASFYGGMGIGFLIVLTLFSGVQYLAWRHGQHILRAHGHLS